jgi:type I restriction enzyme R subunit
VDRRDKRTRQVRWEQLDDDLVYNNRQLDREVVSTSQIRTILQTLRDYFFTDLFPDRKEVPKTLIFAKDDSHAEDIVQIAREVFGRGNEFCKKITYRTTGDKAEDLIASFRNSYNPRIAVTVDMISTGTDIKPLECLVFMRDVKSSVYFEQMKGRGTRTIAPDELQAVTPGTRAKTHFIIVDAVGVCESDKTDSKPLERKRSVPFDKLLLQVALGVRDEDTLSSLAGRLAQLDRVSEPEDCRAVEAASGGISLRALANGLLNAIDPDAQQAQAQEMSGAAVPTPEQVEQAAAELVNIACAPFDNPALRNTLIEIKGRNEQIIDTLSQDQVISAEFDAAAREKAQLTVTTFKQFIDEHKDELTALQILYNQPFKVKRLTYAAIKDLAAAIQKPPYNLSQEAVWRAYEQLERSKVRKAGPQKLLTNLVSLIRFALEQTDVLEPFPLTVAERYRRWLVEQMNAGRQFTPEQVEWLNRIQEHIAANLTIEKDDFDLTPFYEMGGISKVYRLFGDELGSILNELNEALVG